jgi:alkylated DNA repair dioxygenase AlkB
MPSERLALDSSAAVDYIAGFIEPSAAREIQAELARSEAWEQRAVVLYGRSILQPRLVAWAGELPYRYSGQTLEPRAWSPTLGELRDRVVGETGVPFNHALLNRYRDGNDSMGFHSDDEPELGDDPVVAAVSFGEVRRLVFRSKKKSEARRAPPRLVLDLGHGSLVVMGRGCQVRFRHGVPRQSDRGGERISVTFRLVLRAVQAQ